MLRVTCEITDKKVCEHFLDSEKYYINDVEAEKTIKENLKF